MLLFRPQLLDKQTGYGACLLVWRGLGADDGCQSRCPHSLTRTMSFIYSLLGKLLLKRPIEDLFLGHVYDKEKRWSDRRIKILLKMILSSPLLVTWGRDPTFLDTGIQEVSCSTIFVKTVSCSQGGQRLQSPTMLEHRRERSLLVEVTSLGPELDSLSPLVLVMSVEITQTIQTGPSIE